MSKKIQDTAPEQKPTGSVVIHSSIFSDEKNAYLNGNAIGKHGMLGGHPNVAPDPPKRP